MRQFLFACLGVFALLAPATAAAADAAAIERLKAGEDCVKCDLVGADLSSMSLAGRNLGGAKLNDANLAGVDLTGGNLAGVRMLRADLTGAKLAGVSLSSPISRKRIFPTRFSMAPTSVARV